LLPICSLLHLEQGVIRLIITYLNVIEHEHLNLFQI
jgi:hypothetical protein